MTPANQLTVARLVMAPLFAVFLLRDSVPSLWIASGLFTAAAVTDRIDGWLARRTNTVTHLGRILDPLADKLLVAAAFVALLLLRVPGVEVWMVAVILGREVLVTWLRSHVGRRGVVIHSSPFGKWKTTLQMAVIFAFLGIMSFRALRDPSPAYWKELGQPATVILSVSMVVTALVTLASGLDYVWKNRSALAPGGERP
jgi:CDP-diacylglycerol--glycerol-3-phosphate 3-phosphatidyltransferase